MGGWSEIKYSVCPWGKEGTGKGPNRTGRDGELDNKQIVSISHHAYQPHCLLAIMSQTVTTLDMFCNFRALSSCLFSQLYTSNKFMNDEKNQ